MKAGALLPLVSLWFGLHLTFALPEACSDLHKMYPIDVPASSVFYRAFLLLC